MKQGFPRYKLFGYFLMFCLISSSRFWEFSSSDTHDIDALPWIVFAVRIVPLLIILGILFFDDILNGFKGLLSLRKHYFLVLSIYLLSSFISSLTVYGEIYSAWKTTELIIITYLGAHVYAYVKTVDKKQIAFLLRNYFNVVVLFAIATIISSIIYFDIAFRFSYYQMESVFPPMNSNALGFFALGSLMYFYFVPFKNTALKYVSIGVFFALFFLSLSRTSYIAFFILVGLFVLRNVITLLRDQRISKLRLTGFALVFIVSSAFVVMNGEALLESVTKGQSTEELSEMSHRVFTWQAATLSIKKRPIFGYGLVAETRKLVDKYPSIVTYKSDSIGNVHSSIFECLLASGFVGALPYLLSLVYFFIRSSWFIVFGKMKGNINNIHLFACSFMIVMFFRMITGSALTLVSFEFITLVLLYATKSFPWQMKLSYDK